MAKRKRLTPSPGSGLAAPETKSALAPGGPPIARVAGDSAVAAALSEVSAELAAARAEGRLVQHLALSAVEPDWLLRDRVDPGGPEDPEMAALCESLRAHGQRTPIEVAEIGPGRYGLISGWRRLTALARLAAETGEARFARVLALVRRPESAGAAYVAMVEENEVRVGLSYYERARIVARAAAAGVFESERAALAGLFATASRARRSKIGAFLRVHHALGEALAFPAALSERLGLALARALEEEPALAGRLAAALAETPAADAEAEAALLEAAITRRPAPPPPSAAPARPAPPPAAETGPESGTGAANVTAAGPEPLRKAALQTLPHMPPAAFPDPPPREIRPGVFLERREGRVVLTGPAVGPIFCDRLESWLRREGGG